MTTVQIGSYRPQNSRFGQLPTAPFAAPAAPEKIEVLPHGFRKEFTTCHPNGGTTRTDMTVFRYGMHSKSERFNEMGSKVALTETHEDGNGLKRTLVTAYDSNGRIRGKFQQVCRPDGSFTKDVWKSGSHVHIEIEPDGSGQKTVQSPSRVESFVRSEDGRWTPSAVAEAAPRPLSPQVTEEFRALLKGVMQTKQIFLNAPMLQAGSHLLLTEPRAQLIALLQNHPQLAPQLSASGELTAALRIIMHGASRGTHIDTARQMMVYIESVPVSTLAQLSVAAYAAFQQELVQSYDRARVEREFAPIQQALNRSVPLQEVDTFRTAATHAMWDVM